MLLAGLEIHRVKPCSSTSLIGRCVQQRALVQQRRIGNPTVAVRDALRLTPRGQRTPDVVLMNILRAAGRVNMAAARRPGREMVMLSRVGRPDLALVCTIWFRQVNHVSVLFQSEEQ